MNSSEEKINTGLWATLRSLPRPVWILFFGSFLNKFGTFVMPFLALYMTRQGFTMGDAGLAIGAYGFGSLVASLLGGQLADTIGRRKTIVLSMFAGGISMMLLSQARTLPSIIVLTALAGATGELYWPASSALLADLVPPAQRLTAYAAYRMIFNAGFAFGPATAGFLADRGYMWLFTGDAATSLLFGVIAFVALPRGIRSHDEKAGWKTAAQVILNDRKLHQMIAAALCVGLVFNQMFSTFSLHVTQLGFSPETYGLLISLNGACVVFCELPLTLYTRRFRPRTVIGVGYLLVAIGLALTAFAKTVPLLIASVTIFSLGEITAMSLAATYVANLAPVHLRGRYMGVYGLTWSLGRVVGPVLGMRLFGVSPTTLWILCGGMAALAAVIVVRERSAETASLPQKIEAETV